MRKFLRSNTLFSHKIEGFSKITGLSTNNNNNKNQGSNNKENSLLKRNSIKLIVKNKNNDNKNNNIIKKHSSDSNLVSVNYISDYKLQKKKRDEELQIEIQNLAQILQSKDIKEDIKNENPLIYLLLDKSKRFTEENKNKLIEIIKYILEKQNKTEEETLVIKTYFLKNEKLASLIFPSNIINTESLVNKLYNQIKFEEFHPDSIICKEGDRGEKLYIVLKGESAVVVQKEGKGGECTQFEYIKYLTILYLYQEMSMITRVIYYNKQVMKLEERCILTLFMVFRFYKYYKDNNFFLSENKKIYDKENIYEFIINEKKLKDFIYKKYDYPVEDSINIFDYSQRLIKELYDFYERKIEEINDNSKESEESFFHEKPIQRRPSIFFKPEDFLELNIYSQYYKNKIKINKKLRKKEDIFNKVFSISEISKDKIYKDKIKDYIKRIDFNYIMKNIKEDYNNFHNVSLKLKEEKKHISFFYYSEVNTIKEENMFGELALNNMNKKRTATIITKEECYFAVLTKKVYDSYLKVAQMKSRIKKVLYFTEGPIFKGLLPGTFLNKYFFGLKRILCLNGKVLFNRDDIRNKIYFIVKGELELSCKITLNEMTDIIKKLGGISDNKKEKYLCNLYDEFKNFYINNKINTKICVVNKNQIIGLDDMTLDNKYIFDCKCISTEETEIYEFDYKKFEEALKENDLIMNNNINYVIKRRELFIKILFEQRNSLVELEYKKIKEDYRLRNNSSKIDIKKKNNILSTLIKKVELNNKVLDAYKMNRQIKTSRLLNIKQNSQTSQNNQNNSNNSLNNSKSMNSKNNTNKLYLSSKHQLEDLKNRFKSEKNINKKNVFEKDNNKIYEKTGNTFYPNRNSEKNIKIRFKKNFESILDKMKNNKEIKTEGKDMIKLNIMSSKRNNKYIQVDENDIFNNKNYIFNNYDYTDSSNFNELSHSNTCKILKSLNPFINTSKVIDTRSKRNIIPLLTNCKLSLNKKNINKYKKNNKHLGFKVPSLFKEYSKKYSMIKTKISNVDDFYLDYQENLFNILNKKNNILTSVRKKRNAYSKTENINIIGIKSNKKENKIMYTNFSYDKNRDKNKCIFNGISSPKEAGVIDCLCLDNWAEKTQFEKKYLA